MVGGVPAKKINTLEAFAEKCLAETPKYDLQEYYVNREETIRKLYEK